MNPFHNTTPCFSGPILILSYHLLLGPSSCLFHSDFPIQILQVWLMFHACYIPIPSDSPLVDDSNNVWWRVKIMKPLLFPLARSFQIIPPCVSFRKMFLYGEGLLAPHPTPELVEHPLSLLSVTAYPLYWQLTITSGSSRLPLNNLRQTVVNAVSTHNN
jgi:hypothetical protein